MGKQNHPLASGKLLKIHYQVIPGSADFRIIAQGRERILQGPFINRPNPVQVRVVFQHRRALFFGQHIYLRFRILFLEQPDCGSRQQHVSDLPQLTDKYTLRINSDDIFFRHIAHKQQTNFPSYQAEGFRADCENALLIGTRHTNFPNRKVRPKVFPKSVRQGGKVALTPRGAQYPQFFPCLQPQISDAVASRVAGSRLKKNGSDFDSGSGGDVEEPYNACFFPASPFQTVRLY
ncbi:hypothetical protein [Desulfovibrio sp. Fe33]|uniref:hypothetical protein n=1 Tax=Desulfovibrio sp. Fe33 TaxID=3020842 RepID=UPI00234D0BFA|nr:hypothetical protein [Desulfovibrio sp. Fe33]